MPGRAPGTTAVPLQPADQCAARRWDDPEWRTGLEGFSFCGGAICSLMRLASATASLGVGATAMVDVVWIRGPLAIFSDSRCALRAKRPSVNATPTKKKYFKISMKQRPRTKLYPGPTLRPGARRAGSGQRSVLGRRGHNPGDRQGDGAGDPDCHHGNNR